MLIDEKQFAAQVEAVTKQLVALADGLAVDGLLGASGTVLAGVQAIKVLWTQAHPAPAAQPEPSDPQAPTAEVP